MKLKWFNYVLLCFPFLLLSVTPCDAHKIKMFASAEGNLITGYVYYTTGGKPKNSIVFVQDANGNRLGEVTTNEDGEFTFSANARRDYVFVLELADGHRTTFTITADELPDSLPDAGTEQTDVSKEEQKGVQEKVESPSPEESTSIKEEIPPQISLEEIEKIVDTSVSKQVRPLREQLEQYEEKIRMHDILGGIGYIIGLMGLWYFISTRKKQEK